MTAPVVLVVAKAPVPGKVKTRLAVDLGDAAAARLAAAALLDTLDACEAAFERCHLALAGDLRAACSGDAIADRLRSWTVHAQVGEGLGERLAHAHRDAGRVARAPVVQLGMDTPQVTPDQLTAVATALDGADAVLGAARDGGWWVLGLRDPALAETLPTVPMSLATTYRDTRAALVRRGATVRGTETLADVDTVADAQWVATAAPHSRFAAEWASCA